MQAGHRASRFGFHATPRATDDADFVVEPPAGCRIDDLTAHLPDGIRLEPRSRFETVTASTMRVFVLRDSSFRLELFLLTDDAYDREHFSRRYRLETPFGAVRVPTGEDVVVNKLLWVSRAGRPKDRDDCRSVIAVQGPGIAWSHVARWCDVHDTRTILDAIRSSIPPDLCGGSG